MKDSRLWSTIFVIILQNLLIHKVATLDVCLGFFLQITCPQQQEYITITSLTYGVSSNSTCSRTCCPQVTDCRRTVQSLSPAEDATIRDKCQGKTSCFHQTQSDVAALTSACGSDPQYIVADFTCNPAPPTTTTPPPPTTTKLITTTKRAVISNKPEQSTPKGLGSSTTTPTGGAPSPGGLSTGALIGIIAGAVVAVIIVVIVVVVLVRRGLCPCGKQAKPRQPQFPPVHQGGAAAVPVRSGHDDIYGFLPGAPVEPDAKRANRTSAFIKEHQANGDTTKTKTGKDVANVVIKNETKGGKKKSSSAKTDSKKNSDDGGARPKSSNVKREDSQNRKVPNLLGPGERRHSRPKEVTVAPHYDNPRKSRNLQPGETTVPPADEDVEVANTDKTESPKTAKLENTNSVEKNKMEKTKNTQQGSKPKSAGPEQTNKTGAKPNDKKSDSKKLPTENGEHKGESKKGPSVIGIHNPAFDSEDHNEEGDEFKGTQGDYEKLDKKTGDKGDYEKLNVKT